MDIITRFAPLFTRITTLIICVTIFLDNSNHLCNWTSHSSILLQEVVTVAPGSLPDYDLKKKEFFNEHLHEHEEVRLILEGGGTHFLKSSDNYYHVVYFVDKITTRYLEFRVENSILHIQRERE